MRRKNWVLVVLSTLLLGIGCSSNDTECGDGTIEEDGICIPDNPLACANGTEEVDGECVPDGSVICETGTTFNSTTGVCEADITGCAAGTVLVNGECVPFDDTLVADVTEPGEPNGFGANDIQGTFDLPAAGSSIVIGGCITPFEDTNNNGELDADVDVFIFAATAPVVLDITVDGVEGMAGAFLLFGLDGALAADDFTRIGLSLVSDTSQRKLFLPAAGTYAIAFADSRTVIGGQAFGDADTCYFATIATEAVPSATPATGLDTGTLGDPEFYSFDPTADDAAYTAVLEGTGPAADGGVVLLVNNQYRASFEDDDEDTDALRRLHDLNDADAVTIVVDPVLDFSLTGQAYTLATVEQIPLPDPGDGNSVSVTHDAVLPALLSFDATAGDVVRIEFDAGADLFDIQVFAPSGTDLIRDRISTVCEGCTATDQWIHVQETGTYTYQVVNVFGKDGIPYNITFDRTHRTPQTLVSGTPVTLDVANGDDLAFFTLDASATPDWIEFTAVTNAGTVDIPVASVYDATLQGELDERVIEDQFNALDGMARITAGDTNTYLIAVSDFFADGDEVIDVDFAERAHTVVTVDANTPFAETDTALTSDGSNFYLITIPENSQVSLDLTSVATVNPAVIRLDELGDARVVGVNDNGAGGNETFISFVAPTTYAVEIFELDGNGDGDYDLDLATLDLVFVQSPASPVAAVPDNDINGLDQTVTSAACNEIAQVFVDIDIEHTYRGDLSLLLQSPTGTVVILKLANAFDPGDDVVGTFGAPGGLVSDESLDAFIGEDGAGTWTLNVADENAGDTGTINSWAVNLACF